LVPRTFSFACSLAKFNAKQYRFQERARRRTNPNEIRELKPFNELADNEERMEQNYENLMHGLAKNR
jgi:hypothetical protein